MDGSAFWMQDCPERGAGLTHMHANQCKHAHNENTCCHCGVSPDQAAHFAVLPPIDIEARLNGSGPVKVTKEAALAVGKCYGPADGVGRGPLTVGQMYYLARVRDMVERRQGQEVEA